MRNTRSLTLVAHVVRVYNVRVYTRRRSVRIRLVAVCAYATYAIYSKSRTCTRMDTRHTPARSLMLQH